MKSLQIIAFCIGAAVLYGVVHDQVTARICVEYFSVFHPPVFPTDSPTLLGVGWGIIATWWVGAILGVGLAIAARAGTRPKLVLRNLVPLIFCLLLVMAICAALAGAIGYFYGTPPDQIISELPSTMYRRFTADWWAHGASYGVGFLGGLLLIAVVWIRRQRITEVRPSTSAST